MNASHDMSLRVVQKLRGNLLPTTGNSFRDLHTTEVTQQRLECEAAQWAH